MDGRAHILHDKEEIAAYLREDIYLHLYGLGDLDDFFWNHTIWYALKRGEHIKAIVLLYAGPPPPTLLALDKDLHSLQELLAAILPLLPSQLYAHLSPGLEEVLAGNYRLQAHGEHYKMAMTDRSRLHLVDSSNAVRLSRADLPTVTELYERSYPGNWFNPRMLETGHYYGIKAKGRLVSIAGVHVYSEAYGVAALGNITTHPEHRGRGLGKKVTARLCSALIGKVDHIGLNVKADNQPALSVYRALGFEVVASYGEYMLESKLRAVSLD